MTFTVQEVPDWDISVEEIQMYDLTLADILAEQDQCLNNILMQPDEIKVEDPYAVQYQPTTTSMLASPAMNMPVFCESYNPYAHTQQQAVRNLASPPNTYVHSPADSSSYSVSPIESPQQPLPPDDFMRYVSRQQPYPTNHVVPQVANNEFGYYYNNDCLSGKRRRRDDELSPEEYEKRRLRRERNKEAALRCRNRRRERIEALEQETSEIEEKNEEVQIEISKLRSQIEELKDILKGHNCQKNINSNDCSQKTANDVKVKPEPE